MDVAILVVTSLTLVIQVSFMLGNLIPKAYAKAKGKQIEKQAKFKQELLDYSQQTIRKLTPPSPPLSSKRVFDLEDLERTCELAVQLGEAPFMVDALDNKIIALGKEIVADKIANASECIAAIAKMLEPKDGQRIVSKSKGMFEFIFQNNRCTGVSLYAPLDEE